MKTIEICMLAGILVFTPLSCEKGLRISDIDLSTIEMNEYFDSEIFSENDLKIYGKWRITGISGGFSGQGYEPDFEYLVIKKFGIYAFVKNDKILEYGKIVPAMKTANDSRLKVNLEKDVNSDTFFYDREKYVEFPGNDIMNLNSPPADRYNYHFERVN